jgi:bifunctional DNase/RNase
MALTEIAGARSLAIVIGPAEAHSIVIVMEKMPITRPLTHDLFVSLAENFDIHVEEVFIYQMIDGIFYARIVVSGNNKIVEVDSRTSDAVAIAIRFGAPIFCAKEVMDEVGRDMRALTEGDDLDFDLDITEEDLEEELSPEEILKKLNEALLNEDYELASKLRDELEKRNKK